MTDRYKIINKSLSCHCCFEYTIVDTTRPYVIGYEHYVDSDGVAHYENMAECFDIDNTRMIVDALNKGETNA